MTRDPGPRRAYAASSVEADPPATALDARPAPPAGSWDAELAHQGRASIRALTGDGYLTPTPSSGRSTAPRVTGRSHRLILLAGPQPQTVPAGPRRRRTSHPRRAMRPPLRRPSLRLWAWLAGHTSRPLASQLRSPGRPAPDGLEPREQRMDSMTNSFGEVL